jgi:methionyl-tRNA formyltransferase
MIEKDDGRIDWTQPALVIARMVRAFNPWPTAFTYVGGKLLKVYRARAVATRATVSAGTVSATHNGISIATGDGILVVDELQLQGRKRLSAAEFVRGGGVKVGAALGSLVAPASKELDSSHPGTK